MVGREERARSGRGWVWPTKGIIGEGGGSEGGVGEETVNWRG